MSTQSTIRTYYLMVNRLNSRTRTTKKALFEYLNEEGLVGSMRTLDRRFEELRNEFHLEVPYDPATNTYSLSESDMESLDGLLRFLEMNTFTGLLGDAIKSSREALRYISFDTDGSFTGLKYLSPIMNAIQSKQTLNFSYQKFSGEKIDDTDNFCPLLLREYLGRWYMAGTFAENTKMFTYGLDRITSIKVNTQIFIPTLANPAKEFESVVGISISEPETVELALTASQAKYLKTLPLHKSQAIISETGDEVIFGLLVAPNYELVQRILMLGKEVRVLKPDRLVIWVKDILSGALEHYC
ncbi:MAG: WYL domain-containing protein [Bacteroidales bacterium]|nr:WYL domain-containing protein [Bacteroidales bacterium]